MSTTMKAVRVVGYHQPLQIDEIPKPEITGPFDVIVRIGGAGVCRTDLHILEGQWAEKSGVELPYTIGHENAAGWRPSDRLSPTSARVTASSSTRSSRVGCAVRVARGTTYTARSTSSPASTPTVDTPST